MLLFGVIKYSKSETVGYFREMKMIESKHLIHFYSPIRLVLHQHLKNLHGAYLGFQPENSNHTRALSALAIVPSQVILIKV